MCYTKRMKFDYQTLYASNLRFLEKRPFLKKWLPLINHVLTGSFFVAYAALLAYVFTADLSAAERLKPVFIPLLCLLTVSVLRMAIDRPRPYASNGAGIVPLVEKKNQDNKSFPSRHLACAAVIAMTCLPYFLWGGCLLFAFGILLGFIRFSMGLHYPTDLLAGFTLGILCGCVFYLL
ncbi:MAG: phosphatase PAP2 family protein [Clostridia bacterium]|nr:phosphatase PAP2 family protein [Clostridia bacterium]